MTTKQTKGIYWTTTVIVFLFEGLMPALTSHTQLAVSGIRHLGYPDYFRTMLTVFKVAGAAALILPFVRGRIKEWAYAGFSFTMIAACVSHWAVDGPGVQTFFPLFLLGILALSYLTYRKLDTSNNNAANNTITLKQPGMSFQAYLNNIEAKTGKRPADFKIEAEQKGFMQNGTLKQGIKAGAVVDWLKETYDLGHGHAMAIYALLKGAKTERSP